MSNLSEVVFSLEKKIQALLAEYEKTKRSKSLLVEEIRALKSENELLKEALIANEQKVNTLKTANALLGSNDFKRETKLKINTLIREIDACIVSISE